MERDRQKILLVVKEMDRAEVREIKLQERELAEVRAEKKGSELMLMEKVIGWDEYFMGIANAVAVKSSCLSRKLGTILVKDRKIIASGYNGPAKNIPHCDSSDRRDYLIREYGITGLDVFNLRAKLDVCPRQILGFASGTKLSYCNAVHAEANCIASAAQMGHATEGSILYMNNDITPCKDCMGLLVNAGIGEVVMFGTKKYTDSFTFQHCDIKFRKYNGDDNEIS